MDEAQITKQDVAEASEDNPLGVDVGQVWRHDPPGWPTTTYTVTHFKSPSRPVFFALIHGFEVRATVRLSRMDPDEWTRIADAS